MLDGNNKTLTVVQTVPKKKMKWEHYFPWAHDSRRWESKGKKSIKKERRREKESRVPPVK